METATAVATALICAEPPQFVRRLQRENQTDEESNQGKDRQCTDSGVHGL